jgi:tetratricopeptide (TPR) repeat protein
LHRLAFEEDHPEKSWILEALTEGFHKNLQFSEKTYCLQKWLELCPQSPRAYFCRADSKELARLFDEAIQDFLEVVRLDPSCAQARVRLAHLLSHQNRYQEALEHFQHLHRVKPEDPTIALGLIKVWQGLGNAARAKELLDESRQKNPEDKGLQGYAGQVALAEGHPDVAEALLRQALNQDPFELEWNYALEQCLSRQGKIEEAAVQQKKTKQLRDDIIRFTELTQKLDQAAADVDVRYECGVISLRIGKTEGGLRWLRSAHLRDPQHLPTNRALADYYQKIGDLQGAEYHRKRAGMERPPK